jgi:hypothetical protein
MLVSTLCPSRRAQMLPPTQVARHHPRAGGVASDEPEQLAADMAVGDTVEAIPPEVSPGLRRQRVAPGHLRQRAVEGGIEDGHGRNARCPPGGRLDHGHVRRVVQRGQVT